mmetsp:Transcript_22359/g.84824  ORF Transcript_22359/g.84824 Transcript_22359/m.84824 type:complete len:270 (-) Transcript_22359:402-1211(-)
MSEESLAGAKSITSWPGMPPSRLGSDCTPLAAALPANGFEVCAQAAPTKTMTAPTMRQASTLPDPPRTPPASRPRLVASWPATSATLKPATPTKGGSVAPADTAHTEPMPPSQRAGLERDASICSTVAAAPPSVANVTMMQTMRVMTKPRLMEKKVTVADEFRRSARRVFATVWSATAVPATRPRTAPMAAFAAVIVPSSDSRAPTALRIAPSTVTASAPIFQVSMRDWAPPTAKKQSRMAPTTSCPATAAANSTEKPPRGEPSTAHDT